MTVLCADCATKAYNNVCSRRRVSHSPRHTTSPSERRAPVTSRGIFDGTSSRYTTPVSTQASPRLRLIQEKKTQRCWRCDDTHDPQVCRFKTATCKFCQKQGHIEKACITKRRQLRPKTSVQRNNNVDAQVGQTQDNKTGTALTSSALYDLNTVMNLGTRPKIMTEIMVHQRPIKFEVDSGAACTLISEDTFRATWSENAPALLRDGTQLRTWSGQTGRLKKKNACYWIWMWILPCVADARHMLPDGHAVSAKHRYIRRGVTLARCFFLNISTYILVYTVQEGYRILAMSKSITYVHDALIPYGTFAR